MHRECVLVADDEKTIRESLSQILRDEGFQVVAASDGQAALEHLKAGNVDVALLDIRMPKMDGLEVLARSKEVSPKTQVILITAFGSVEDAVDAVKKGASDYVTKPFIFDDILIKINRVLGMRRLVAENLSLRTELEGSSRVDRIVGASPSLKNALGMVEKLAPTRASALITGESGTGKEFIARAIHYNGVTRDARFMPVNCSALPEALVESELFGYRRGAFTGAAWDKPGVFELADRGTVFFDEIGNMPLSMQAKLLRAIEEKRITPLGGTEPIDVNVRILCAANSDLAKQVGEGTFRADLYYRLNVVEIHLAPLRERREDIPALASHFVANFSEDLGKGHIEITDQALHAMIQYAWPGNIRELRNVIERAIILGDGKTIDAADLTFADKTAGDASMESADLKTALRSFERRRILRALQENDFDKTAAARALNIGLSSLYRKIDELDIPKRMYRGDGASDGVPEAKRDVNA